MLQATYVKVLRDICLAPHTLLRKGETGKIMRREIDALGLYSMDVRMDRKHTGLAEWDNEAHLVFPELLSLACAPVVPLRATIIYSVIIVVVVGVVTLEALLGFL